MIPVINKIDLPSADVVRTQEMIENAVGLDATDAIPVSAKTGAGRRSDVLEAIVHRLPPPTGDPDAPLQALIFDSWFDAYRGVIVLARVMQGTMRKGAAHPADVEWAGLRCRVDGRADAEAGGDCRAGGGRGGLLRGDHQELSATRKIGDTITEDGRPAPAPLPGFEDIKSMVFAGLYTVDSHEHTLLRDALEKLRLNDSSFFVGAGELGRTGVRIPLRLPRTAAHGDHPGAAGARVRPGPDHDGAGRAVQDHG